MTPRLQSRQEVTIHAPLAEVWEFNQDLTRIPEYHPRVAKVDLISGQRERSSGGAYRCHLTDGKNTCVERDIDVVPMAKIVTVMPEDTLGIAKTFADYQVDTDFTATDATTTRMSFSHHYSTPHLKQKFIHLVARRRIARESQATLDAIKKAIEQRSNP